MYICSNLPLHREDFAGSVVLSFPSQRLHMTENLGKRPAQQQKESQKIDAGVAYMHGNHLSFNLISQVRLKAPVAF